MAIFAKVVADDWWVLDWFLHDLTVDSDPLERTVLWKVFGNRNVLLAILKKAHFGYIVGLLGEKLALLYADTSTPQIEFNLNFLFPKREQQNSTRK